MLIDAVVHAVNEDYDEMAGDFIKLGFLSAGRQQACTACGVLCQLEQQWMSTAPVACVFGTDHRVVPPRVVLSNAAGSTVLLPYYLH